MQDLAPIKARIAAATPGPWEATKHRRNADGGTPEWWALDDQWGVYPPDTPPGVPAYGGPIALVAGSEFPGNAALIAHAPADLAALVAEVEAWRAKAAREASHTEDGKGPCYCTECEVERHAPIAP